MNGARAQPPSWLGKLDDDLFSIKRNSNFNFFSLYRTTSNKREEITFTAYYVYERCPVHIESGLGNHSERVVLSTGKQN